MTNDMPDMPAPRPAARRRIAIAAVAVLAGAAIGFAGMAIMGMQFLITARFRHVSEPYGMDIMYHFHRQIS